MHGRELGRERADTAVTASGARARAAEASQTEYERATTSRGSSLQPTSSVGGGHFHGCLLCGLNRWSNKTETGNSAHAMNLTICKFAKGSMGSVSDSLLFHLKTPRNFKVHQRGIGKM